MSLFKLKGSIRDSKGAGFNSGHVSDSVNTVEPHL